MRRWRGFFPDGNFGFAVNERGWRLQGGASNHISERWTRFAARGGSELRASSGFRDRDRRWSACGAKPGGASGSATAPLWPRPGRVTRASAAASRGLNCAHFIGVPSKIGWQFIFLIAPSGPGALVLDRRLRVGGIPSPARRRRTACF
jgi:hypothetical protein